MEYAPFAENQMMSKSPTFGAWGSLEHSLFMLGLLPEILTLEPLPTEFIELQ